MIREWNYLGPEISPESPAPPNLWRRTVQEIFDFLAFASFPSKFTVFDMDKLLLDIIEKNHPEFFVLKEPTESVEQNSALLNAIPKKE